MLSSNFYVIKEESKNGRVKLCLDKIKDVSAFVSFLNENDGKAPDIPEGIEIINEDLFKNVAGIKSIYIPFSVKSISANIFFNNKDAVINYADYYDLIIREMTPDRQYRLNLKINNIHNTQKFNDYCLSHNGQNAPIPDGVTSIGDFVFKDNDYLKELILNPTTICMCKQACKNCVNLQRVILSPEFFDFGEEIFAGCKNLKYEISLNKDMGIIRANVFNGCDENLVIKIFDKYPCSLKNFVLNGKLKNMVNIVEIEKDKPVRSIRTNNYLFVKINNNYYKLGKRQLKNCCKFNKFLGYCDDNVDKLFIENKGENAFKFLSQYKKEKIDFPPMFVINKTPYDYINNYFDGENAFNNMILSKLREKSSIKTNDAKGNLVGRFTEKQYEIIYALAVISGFFENDKQREKSHRLFTRELFGLEKGNYPSLNLSMEKFAELFDSILNFSTYEYNEEFANYFLYNLNNLNKLVSTIELNIEKGNNLYLFNLIKNCGASLTQYVHSGVSEASLGKLHDKWLVYKNNNNNKKINLGVEKEEKVLSFIEWALLYGDGKSVLLELNKDDIENEKLLPFVSFYTSIKPIEKLAYIFNESKDVVDYIMLPESDNRLEFERKSYFIEKVGSKIEISREFIVPRVKKEYIEEVNDFYKKIEKEICTREDNLFFAKIISKKSPLIAQANCEMGHCANVCANGCEYLFEAYLSKDCQPFMIFKKDNEGRVKPIANFRIDLNLQDNLGCITCLEVKSEVKFEYSQKDKIEVARVFLEVIDKYVKMFNNLNENKINYITMGQICHCDINDVLSMYFPILSNPIYCNKFRKVVRPSEYNHFLIWDYKKDNSCLKSIGKINKRDV